MKNLTIVFAVIFSSLASVSAQIPADRGALLDGSEGDYGKTAEVNNYPSPGSLLELATTLNLSSVQKNRLKEIQNSAIARARQLGREIVQIENELHQAFQARIVSEISCADDAQQIGRLRGKLRGVFLAARVKAKSLLNESQINMYRKIKGEAKNK